MNLRVLLVAIVTLAATRLVERRLHDADSRNKVRAKMVGWQQKSPLTFSAYWKARSHEEHDGT